MRWDDLRVFLALIRGRSLTAAAALLGLNPSTVGRRIDALEDALGARLFDRTPDGAAPTEAAESLLAPAEDMERAAIAAAGAAADFEAEAEGTVRLTAPPGIVDFLLAEPLAELRRRHPRLCIEVDASIGYADLTRREADVAIRLLRPRSGDLVVRALPSSPYAVLGHCDLFGGRRALRRTDALPWIAWGAELAHLSTGRWLEAHVPVENVALRTSAMTAQIRAAEAGVGALLAPLIYTTCSSLQAIRLAPTLRATLPEADDVWLVGHRALRHVPRVAALWDLIVERFG